MNKHNFHFLGFSVLVTLAIAETALIASPQEAPPLALAGPSRAAAYPASPTQTGPRVDGIAFSVPLLAGFTGAAIASGDVVMTSPAARIDVTRAERVRAEECATRVDASATMALTEAWRADGEGGCRAWMSLPRRHVIEVVVNHGEHAYVVTCASKDANVVQDVCAPVIGGLRIAGERNPTAS